IAEVYTPATPQMITQLEKLLQEGKILYLVSGGSLASINDRIVNSIHSSQRKNILVAHCSGAEVWGYKSDGQQQEHPYYSLYDQNLTTKQKQQFREIITQLIQEFQLKTHRPMGSKSEFRNL